MHRLSLLLLALSMPAAAVPGEFTQQGRIFDSLGAPLDGSHDLVLAIYDTTSGGTAAWTETHTGLTFDDGYFALDVGSVTALDVALFEDNDDLYLAMSVDGGPDFPTRIKLQSVPYALVAGQAASVSGGTVDASEVMVNGTTVIANDGTIDYGSLTGAPTVTLSSLTCSTGEILQYSTSGWGCIPLEIDASAITSGTIIVDRLPIGDTSGTVAAGDHLHQASDITGGSIDIGMIPVGTGSGTVAAGDHTHDAADIATGTLAFARLPVGTAATEVARGDHTHAMSDLTVDVMNGASAMTAGTSCKQILDDGHAGGDGLYFVDPGGAGKPMQVYCDMTTDGGGWTLVWRHSYRESILTSGHLSNDMRFYSATHTPCLMLHNAGSGWCNVPDKTTISTGEMRIMASHKGRTVYDYSGPVHANIDTNWQGGYLGSSPTKLFDACSASNGAAPESVNPSTGYAVAGITFDKTNPGVFTGNCDSDRYNGSSPDCRWENCTLPGSISPSTSHTQMSIHMFVR